MGAEEALGRLAPEERAWVEAFRDRIRAEVGSRVRDIRLFGSRVRGDAHGESDIDLLVLIEDCDHATAMSARRSFTTTSDTIGRSRATGFYKEMRKESVRL